MPLKPGRHSSGDGSFGRSAGMAAGRGAAVLVIAVVIGILLLNKVDDPPARQGSAGANTSQTDVTDTTVATPVPTTAPARPPGEVKVLSANGTKVNGAAGKVRDSLKALGYNVLSPLETKQPVQASVVYFASGYDREAQAVAQVLQLAPTAVAPLPAANALPVADLRGANVVAVVGPDLAKTATTTTAKKTTTTVKGKTTSTSTTATTAKPPG